MEWILARPIIYEIKTESDGFGTHFSSILFCYFWLYIHLNGDVGLHTVRKHTTLYTY